VKTLILAALLATVATPSVAGADNITIGLYAPSEPFPSTAARVDLAKKLGDHLGAALGGKGVGRVFARAGDFSSAVKKGEVTVALVDATFLASAGSGYTVIAAATRSGDATHGWQLVARGAEKISQLKGKRVLVPSVGGRESDFVLNVLLGGEVGKDFFGKIEAAPDTASTLAALGLGKADAAVVPASADLPGGVTTVLRLPSLSGPLLVAYGPVTPAQKAALIKGATELLQKTLGKNPATTFVIIDEVETDNWGIAGESVTVRRARGN